MTAEGVRFALVQAGEVVNVIMAPEGYVAAEGIVAVRSDTAGIGDSYDGETFTRPPSETPEPHPLVVTAAQAKLALFNAGLYDTVLQAVSQIGYEPIRIYFENAATWSSDHPYVQGLAAELELTDEQVVALFEAARLL